MEPVLKEGEMVWVSNWAYLFNQPKAGDVIVFSYQNKHLLKRLTKLQGNSAWVAGDNVRDSLNLENSGEIKRSDIIGKVVFKNI